MYVLLTVAILALLALAASVHSAGRVLCKTIYLKQFVAPHIETVSLPLEIQSLEARIEELTLAVASGILHVNRAEKRVAKSVTGARKLLRDNGLEHAGLEAEVAELRDTDEPRGEEETVQPVPPDVDRNRKTGIPGVSFEELEAYREAVANV